MTQMIIRQIIGITTAAEHKATEEVFDAPNLFESPRARIGNNKTQESSEITASLVIKNDNAYAEGKIKAKVTNCDLFAEQINAAPLPAEMM